MNATLMSYEIVVVLLGLALLLADLWTPAERKHRMGYVAVLALLYFFGVSFYTDASSTQYAFGRSYILDDLALFFKRIFLLAGTFVLIGAAEFGKRFKSGIVEFYALILFALAGMLFAASANNFVMLFVSLELITVTFYVLVSFERNMRQSLESGVKYLIMGALSSAFLVLGIAMVFGASGTIEFHALSEKLTAQGGLLDSGVFQLGMLLVMAGLGFKIAAVPFQFWVPDVYQGAPTPVTAFLAIGSKAAGIVLFLRLFCNVVPLQLLHWEKLIGIITVITILYGNLCAIPQRNLKRLLGYSGIAHAGYLMLGLTTFSQAGATAILYYLAGYLFTVLAAFAVVAIVARESGTEDIGSLAGLGQRSPFLAAGMTLAMVSLAGIPPLAGFFGKFLLLKAVIQQGTISVKYYWLAAAAVMGVVISLYYYFNVIKTIYWSKDSTDLSPIFISVPGRIGLALCMLGIVYMGILPELPLWLAQQGALVLRLG